MFEYNTQKKVDYHQLWVYSIKLIGMTKHQI